MELKFLILSVQGFGLLWELFFAHFRAAQRVLRAVFCTFQGGTACFRNCFLHILGRHSLFWELLFEHLKAAQPVLETAFLTF